MLAANEAVAKNLLFAKQPAIYRVHDRPDPDRLVDLREVLDELRLRAQGRPGGGPARGLPEGPERDRGQARGAAAARPAAARAAQGALLRGVPRPLRARGAVLLPLHLADPALSGPDRPPAALAAPRGRPARRRQGLRSRQPAARARSPPFSSERERRAEAGGAREPPLEEDRVHEGQGRPRVRRLRHRCGILRRVRDARRTSSSRVSCRSPRWADDFFVYEEKQHRLRGRSGGKTYRLGDTLRVKLEAIDEVRRRLDFQLAGRSGRRRVPPGRSDAVRGKAAR